MIAGAPSASPSRPSVVLGSVISLAFWLALLLSALLFAVVALAPRLLAWRELAARYGENAVMLASLQHEIEHLQRMADALERDPDFTLRVAVHELELVPSGTVLFSNDAEAVPVAPPSVTNGNVPEPWYVPVLREAAGPTPLRGRLIAGGVVLCLAAFTCLNEQFMTTGLGRPLGRIGRWCLGRYCHGGAAPGDEFSTE